jgi:hypothetical protein
VARTWRARGGPAHDALGYQIPNFTYPDTRPEAIYDNRGESGLMGRRTFLIGLALVCVSGAAPSRGAEADTAAVEQAALAVLDTFMVSFNAQDAEAHAATLHYPHYRLARGVMSFWETEAAAVEQMTTVMRELPATGWHHSEWVERRIITASPTKVHIATRFKRVRADGSEIGTFDSLYIVIKQDGRWGIKLRSSFLGTPL